MKNNNSSLFKSKVVKKIKFAIKEQSVETLDIWLDLAKKNQCEPIIEKLINEKIYTIVTKPVKEDFFKKLVSSFNDFNINTSDVIERCMNHNASNHYLIIKDVYKENFYNFNCFSKNVLINFFNTGGDYDIDDILKIKTEQDVATVLLFLSDYDIKDINEGMLTKMLNKLDINKRVTLLTSNLFKSVELNNITKVDYFINKLINENVNVNEIEIGVNKAEKRSLGMSKKLDDDMEKKEAYIYYKATLNKLQLKDLLSKDLNLKSSVKTNNIKI